MKIQKDKLRLMKLIHTLLPKYTFREPINTSLGSYLPICKTIQVSENDAFMMSYPDLVKVIERQYVGFFVLKYKGLRNAKNFTILGTALKEDYLMGEILKEWESIGIKHSPYPTIHDPTIHDFSLITSDSYAYYKIWVENEE